MKRFSLILLAAVFAMSNVVAQMNPMQPIPDDPAVRKGKLANGLTYYIRHNEKPKGQADFIFFTMWELFKRVIHSKVSPTSSNTWLSTVRKTCRKSR